MDDWALRVKELIPELVKEHAYIHDAALQFIDSYPDGSFSDFEGLVTDHMNKEETWVFPFMVEQKIYDERSEEIASQHQEITSMLDGLREISGEEFKKRFLELVDLLQRHHAGEEEWLFPRVINFINDQR